MARDAEEIATELLGTGLDQRQCALLTELILSMSTRQSGGTRVESPASVTAEKRRAWDREYRRKRRGASTRHPPDIHPNPPDGDCNLLSSESLKEGNREESKKEEGTEIVALAKRKGTRISPDQKLSDEDREFAWTLGFEDRQIDRLWAEFVDYWVAIPGQRGVKLSWPATWRNRVRAIHERSGQRGTAQDNGFKRALGRLADDIGEDFGGEETRPAPPRLLSHG